MKKVKENGKKWCCGCFTLLMRQFFLEYEGITGKRTAPAGTVMLMGACTVYAKGLPTAELRTAGKAREFSHK